MSRTHNVIGSIAAIVLAGALASSQAAAAVTAAPDARQPGTHLSLVVIEGVPGSAALLRGDYETGLAESLAALDAASGRRMQLANNICAAQSMLGNYEQAAAYCDLALGIRPTGAAGAAQVRLYRAVALVNRGVLQALQGDVAGAAADFGGAARGYASLGVARSNHALLRSPDRAGRVELGEL
jgi:tetratricopeptide (TPR) repeat protein